MATETEIPLKYSNKTFYLQSKNSQAEVARKVKSAIDAEVKAALKAHGIDTGSTGAGDGNSDPYAGVVRPARGAG